MKALYFLFATSLILASCDEDKKTTPNPQPVNLEVSFSHFFGNDSIILDQSQHTNAAGNSLTFETIKFFVSEVSLIKTDGSAVPIPFYGLVDLDRQELRKLSLTNLPEGNYKGIQFTLGLDSAINAADPNSHAPGSPLNALIHRDMYWDWATGYIFTKIEGTYPKAGTPNSFVFHFGFNRWKKPFTLNKDFSLKAGSNALALKADWSKVFNSPTVFNLETMGDFSHSIGDSTKIPVLHQNMTGMMSFR